MEAHPKKQTQIEHIFIKKTPKLSLAVNQNRKNAIQFEKQAIHKTEICKKTSKFQLKQATRKSSKKPQLHKNTSPNSQENRNVGSPEGHVKSLMKTLRLHIIVI